MAKENGSDSNNPHRLSHYSISNLFDLLTTARAQKALVDVGYTPTLVIKGQKIEIDGPDVTFEAMEELLRSVATTRQIRALRNNGTIEFLQSYKQHQILVQFVDAFGVYRMDLLPVASI